MFQVTEALPSARALGSDSQRPCEDMGSLKKIVAQAANQQEDKSATTHGLAPELRIRGNESAMMGFPVAPGLLATLRPSKSPIFLLTSARLLLPGPQYSGMQGSGWPKSLSAMRWMVEAVPPVRAGGMSSAQLQTADCSQATRQAVRSRLCSKWKTAESMLESTSGVLGFFFKCPFQMHTLKKIYLKAGEIN